MRRKISLLIIAVFVAGLATINHGCSRSPDSDADDSRGDFDLSDPKLKERLGEDDGYAFAVMYGADVHGSLETCG
ncbi:MAG: hypothetical protein AABO41_10090 [Acidobacteriota bacterium]